MAKFPCIDNISSSSNNMSANNIGNATDADSRDSALAVAEVSVQAVVFAVAFASNALVLAALVRQIRGGQFRKKNPLRL